MTAPTTTGLRLGLYTDSVEFVPLDDALDLAAAIGVHDVEIATGGQSRAPHMDVHGLLADGAKRAKYCRKLADRDLRIAALNCSAWPMHPTLGPAHEELIRSTIRLAGELGVSKIVTMSGTPGDGPGGTTFNWLWYPWPADALALLERQWQAAVELWTELAALAKANGIERIALELHPLQLVYNVPTLVRLRDAVGPLIGANVDPSHLFWQQMDPLAVVRALGEAVFHVHLKDTSLVPERLAIAGVLDQALFETPDERAWLFRTVGRGHDRAFWASFLASLAEVGYDDVVSIENEDVRQPAEPGVREAAAFIGSILAG
ncbi:MAG: sugar phosphate isomerase/epimerase family protein [Chloroflexota bacterium]